MFILLSTILFILPIFTSAANDWSTPCAGSCAYETGDGETTAWGSILLVSFNTVSVFNKCLLGVGRCIGSNFRYFDRCWVVNHGLQ